MKNITVIVQRFDQKTGKFQQKYIVPVEENDEVSVMDLLEYIYQNLDDSLAFFHHAACRQAACGKCGMRINGKTGLSCKVKADCDEINLEPVNDKIVRDLVCH